MLSASTAGLLPSTACAGVSTACRGRTIARTVTAIPALTATIRVVCASAIALARPQHLHLFSHDLRAVLLRARLVGPLARADAALDIDLGALLQVPVDVVMPGVPPVPPTVDAAGVVADT